MFDIFKQKVIIEIDDIFHKDVQHVKFLSNFSANHIIAVDSRGFLQRIILSKTLLKYKSKSEKIIENPIPDLCTVAALQPKEGMPYEVIEWKDFNITAISSTELVKIFILDNPIRLMTGINREDFGYDFIRKNSISYLDWGYGITPNISRE